MKAAMCPQSAPVDLQDVFEREALWLRHEVEPFLHRSALLTDHCPDDVVQLAFIRAHVTSSELRWTTRAQIRSWLRKTAFSVIGELARADAALKRGGAKKRICLDWLTTTIIGSSPSLHAEDRTPCSQAAYAEAMAELSSAIDSLPEPMRQILTLKFIDRLEEPDIARTTGRSQASVRTLIFRALRLLWDNRMLRESV